MFIHDEVASDEETARRLVIVSSANDEQTGVDSKLRLLVKVDRDFDGLERYGQRSLQFAGFERPMNTADASTLVR
jgi:hypothetical protein